MWRGPCESVVEAMTTLFLTCGIAERFKTYVPDSDLLLVEIPEK